jgi:hypothetical protein
MTTVQALPRRVLYEHDETAWLESMAELIRLGRLNEIDDPNLAEYLADMARRDRRDVESRLTVLIVLALKWTHQPDRRSGASEWPSEILNTWRLELTLDKLEKGRCLTRRWRRTPPNAGGV